MMREGAKERKREHAVPAACRRLVPAFLVLFAAAGAAAADTRVSEVHPLGVAAADTAYELVRGLLSPGGRAVLDEGHHTVVVFDTAERQEAVRRLLKGLQMPLPNVRLETRIVDRETGRVAEISPSGQLVASAPGGTAAGSIHFNVAEKTSSHSRRAEQSVVVASGGEASIEVGREIPYLGWFAAYGEREGILAGDIGWREVGSRLAVSAAVVDGGKRVRLRVVPELAYLVGGSRGRRGRRQETAFTGVAAELEVPSGSEVRLGGGEEEEEEEFYARFLTGYDRQRRVRRVDVFVKPTVLAAPE